MATNIDLTELELKLLEEAKEAERQGVLIQKPLEQLCASKQGCCCHSKGHTCCGRHQNSNNQN